MLQKLSALFLLLDEIMECSSRVFPIVYVKEAQREVGRPVGAPGRKSLDEFRNELSLAVRGLLLPVILAPGRTEVRVEFSQRKVAVDADGPFKPALAHGAALGESVVGYEDAVVSEPLVGNRVAIELL